MPTNPHNTVPMEVEIKMPDDSSVLILGGGFAGWYAARKLAALLPPRVPITVVDRVDHMLYTPMLTEVAGGTVSPQPIAVSQRLVPDRVIWINAEAISFNAESSSATLKDGRTLQAQHLVLALGSTTSYHGIQGAKENSLPFKTLADATLARHRVDQMISKAAAMAPGEDRKNALTLVVAGGGYTGVETMAALYARLKTLAKLKGIDARQIQAVLLEPTDRLMHEMPEPLAAYAKQRLQADGVRVLTGIGVKLVDQGIVTLTNGEQHKPELLIWDTGIEPSPLLKDADVPKGKHHGVIVDATFRVQGFENVWAIGDCAEIPNGSDSTYGPTAQNAVREGDHVAKNIAQVMKGKVPKPFHYKELGQLALISERDAVASVLGFQIKGFIAWAMWWMIYIAKLPGLKNRLQIFRNLLQNLL